MPIELKEQDLNQLSNARHHHFVSTLSISSLVINQDDKLTAGQTGVWSDIIDTWMTEEINAEYRDDDGNMHPLPGPRKRGCDGKPRTKLKQFFNGRITPYNVGQKPTPITWIGFPRLVRPLLIEQTRLNVIWRSVLRRDRQDEYLEWTVKRDEDGRILSVTFTYYCV